MGVMSISVTYCYSIINNFAIEWHNNRPDLLLLKTRVTAIFDNVDIIKY